MLNVFILTFGPVNSGLINFVESGATFPRLPDFTLVLLHPAVLNNQ